MSSIVSKLRYFVIFALLAFGCSSESDKKANDNKVNKLPLDDPGFTGKIGRTYKESTAAWPQFPTPKKDAPNVVIILLDDVGFGMTSTFGGSIPTPHSL